MKTLFFFLYAVLSCLFAFAQKRIAYNQPVALYIEGGAGYLTYNYRSNGVSLGWSVTPSFEWELRVASAPTKEFKNNIPFQLYNTKAKNYIRYGETSCGINLIWGGVSKEEHKYDWFLEGDISKPNPSIYLRNKHQSNKNATDPYLKYGSRSCGVNLLWTRKPSAPNMKLVTDEIDPQDILRSDAKWSFNNFKTNPLSWETFKSAFELYGNDQDLLDPIITFGIFAIARKLTAKDGNCFGMSLLLAYMAKRQSARVPFFGEMKQPIYQYQENEKIIKSINTFHWKQLSTEFLNAYAETLNDNYFSIAEKIKSDLNNNRFGVVSVLKSYTKGHAMVPYKVEETSISGSKAYKIYVYDPNEIYNPGDKLNKTDSLAIVVQRDRFQYQFSTGKIYSHDLCYASFNPNIDYQNLLNSIVELGIVVIGEGTDIEAITDSEGTIFSSGVSTQPAKVVPMLDFSGDEAEAIWNDGEGVPQDERYKLIEEMYGSMGPGTKVLLLPKNHLKNLNIKFRSKAPSSQLMIAKKGQFIKLNNGRTVGELRIAELDDITKDAKLFQEENLTESNWQLGFVNASKILETKNFSIPATTMSALKRSEATLLIYKENTILKNIPIKSKKTSRTDSVSN